MTTFHNEVTDLVIARSRPAGDDEAIQELRHIIDNPPRLRRSTTPLHYPAHLATIVVQKKVE